MRARIVAVSAATLLTATAACGGDDVSSADARRIVVSGLIDAGQPPDVAECTADAALARHSPGELANASGTTSEAVNASVAGLLAGCLGDLTPPTTLPPTTLPPPTTTLPATTVPATTTPPELDTAFCSAGTDVLVVVGAMTMMSEAEAPSTAGVLDELVDRTELTVLTAPDGELQDLTIELHDAAEALHAAAEAVQFDPAALESTDPAAEAAELLDLGADLRAVLEQRCEGGFDGDVTAKAEALADELLALDDVAPATTTPTTDPPVEVEHAETNIVVTVPGDWSGESAGIADTQFGPATRFLVRAPDPAVFTEGRFDGEGVAIYALDGTVDFNAMLAAAGPARSCTLADERAYDDGIYVGVARQYTQCGGAPVSIVLIGATDDDAQVSTVVEIRTANLDDRSIDLVLNSFYV